jgi:hypothetical protein
MAILPYASLVVSLLALTISAATTWLTLLRPARLKATRPSQIYLGPDGPRGVTSDKSKIYLRMFLIATARRGVVIENLSATLERDETRQSFNVWVHQDGAKYVRGGGMFVPETGVAATHQFLHPTDIAPFEFRAGTYKLTVYARLLGRPNPQMVVYEELTITPEIWQEMKARSVGVYFDQSTEVGRYLASFDSRRE